MKTQSARSKPENRKNDVVTSDGDMGAVAIRRFPKFSRKISAGRKSLWLATLGFLKI
jgi:hypothetical protein